MCYSTVPVWYHSKTTPSASHILLYHHPAVCIILGQPDLRYFVLQDLKSTNTSSTTGTVGVVGSQKQGKIWVH